MLCGQVVMVTHLRIMVMVSFRSFPWKGNVPVSISNCGGGDTTQHRLTHQVTPGETQHSPDPRARGFQHRTSSRWDMWAAARRRENTRLSFPLQTRTCALNRHGQSERSISYCGPCSHMTRALTLTRERTNYVKRLNESGSGAQWRRTSAR